ncbi:hypothetical protein SAMN05421858_4826 [Haladaptatus litoreus]|uniref:Uncharacterized protein n=1 Tax=Haladaptatus litoreus TaxID=553468 RepID=A0A1N7F950_9EURY|nr:hypothetical protein [Haladaptatus litoreus]SIR96745.1 hypothetical protein SAMN05421858_4826 [Haladaptatus litoreus]
MTDRETVLALACADPIQINTEQRTFTGVVYQCEHSEPELTCRGPEPGEHVLYVATPTHDLYRLLFAYYDEIEHTEATLEHYDLSPSGRYTWLRTGAQVECIINPTGGEQA